MKREVTKRNDSGGSMNKTGALNPTEQIGKKGRPLHLRKLEHHPGQRKRHKADDDEEVRKTLCARETSYVVPRLACLCLFSSIPQLFERSRQPQERMYAKEREHADKQGRHRPVRVE